MAAHDVKQIMILCSLVQLCLSTGQPFAIKADWSQTKQYSYTTDNTIIRGQLVYIMKSLMGISANKCLVCAVLFWMCPLTWQADFSSSGDSYPAQIMEGLRVSHQYAGLLQVWKSTIGSGAWFSFLATWGNIEPEKQEKKTDIYSSIQFASCEQQNVKTLWYLLKFSTRKLLEF